MLQLGHTLCKIGIHKWSEWISVDTPIEAATGHDVLDSIDNLYVTTKTRDCDRCGKGHIKQLLRW